MDNIESFLFYFTYFSVYLSYNYKLSKIIKLLRMTTFTTYNVNDIVFIENIGYGTLMDYNKSKSASIKEIPLVI